MADAERQGLDATREEEVDAWTATASMRVDDGRVAGVEKENSTEVGQTGAAMPPGTQAIARTLAVLEVCAKSEVEVGIAELSRTLSLTPGTVHRIVRALQAKGYLAQNPATEKYCLGRAALVLGERASLQLGMSAAMNYLVQLRDACGESVNLGARVGDEMEVLIRAESRRSLRISQAPGHRLPVFASAMGKVSLAYGDKGIEEEVRAISASLRSLTSTTITSPEQLTHELNIIIQQGYSIDDGEAVEGVRCVAAPVLSSQGQLLCTVAVQAPTVRMSFQRCHELAESLREVAKDIATALPTLRPLGL